MRSPCHSARKPARGCRPPGGAWYTEAVRWAAGCGVVKGYDNGCFGPNDAVTREQMAAILYRYAQHKGYDVSAGEDTNILSFDDAFAVSEYAIPAMQWACELRWRPFYAASFYAYRRTSSSAALRILFIAPTHAI